MTTQPDGADAPMRFNPLDRISPSPHAPDGSSIAAMLADPEGRRPRDYFSVRMEEMLAQGIASAAAGDEPNEQEVESAVKLARAAGLDASTPERRRVLGLLVRAAGGP